MIQAYLRGDGGDLLVIGITRGNVDRLTAGQPIMTDLQRRVDRVVIFFGETKPAIIEEIEAKTPFRFEAAHKAAAEADPL